MVQRWVNLLFNTDFFGDGWGNSWGNLFFSVSGLSSHYNHTKTKSQNPIQGLPSGERLHFAMEHHHFSWENPLFLWPFSIAMSVHQRVNHIKIPLNHHFPMVFLWFSYGFPMVFPRSRSANRSRLRPMFLAQGSRPARSPIGELPRRGSPVQLDVGPYRS